MFSIAAINDTDSKSQWEQPLAPSKEAQEFHLSQTYHEGLLKLEAKDYEKAQELLEAVLKDPLVSNAQLDNSASDGHLLQLRFLALKNLATVFLQQGSTYHERALHCYLQAVEIDTKDSVVWNQLGTLACSMGLLSISRWAFEQGLFCSPNNWNCMEKLLEVLIAIGDEVACLSVAELILRHWPSHTRALHVKNTIEESEPIPFAPRGIDKLEPKHIRLKFPEKRKTIDGDLDEGVASKKLKQNIEVDLVEASWIALAGKLIDILCPSLVSGSDLGTKIYRSGNVRISIKLPHMSENFVGSVVKKKYMQTASVEKSSAGDCSSEKSGNVREKEAATFEEQPQERRSSRLESLRSRKPGKEESGFTTSKDPAKVVMQSLGPFLVRGGETEECRSDVCCSFHSAGSGAKLETEYSDVIRFIENNCQNYGAYHMGHLLLEEIASKGILYQDGMAKILELEKLTRHWGQERTPECSLFLAELYYDFALLSLGSSAMSDFTSEASYHLCKIIESVALEYPFNNTGLGLNESSSMPDVSQQACQISKDANSSLSSNNPFWVRFFWLSGQLSLLDGDRTKAREEFYVSLSLLTKGDDAKSSPCSVCLPHCKAINKLSVDKVLHEINLLEVDDVLKKTIASMVEKGLYSECVNVLAPLLFSAKDVYLDGFCVLNREGKEFTSVELSALDVLLGACEHVEPMNFEVYLNCHRRKLQILMAAAGVEEYTASKMLSGSKVCNGSDTESEESPSKHWYQLVAVEVKAISQCASRIKGMINPCGDSSGVTLPMAVIRDIQSLLLGLMCNIAGTNFCKKSCSLEMSDQSEQSRKCYFIDTVIAFSRVQHLIPNVSIKIQMELVVAIHNMLAEFGVCCARGDGEEEEGTFLKLAIKHLLALDMKLKTVFHSLNKVLEMNQSEQQSSHDNHVKESKTEVGNDQLNVGVSQTDGKTASTSGKDDAERIRSEDIPFRNGPEEGKSVTGCDKHVDDENDGVSQREKENTHLSEGDTELTEEEREELELGIDNALDQCFHCLYGLNLRSDSSYEDDLAVHKNTCRGDYQTKEQCADVFQYILPYAKASSRTGLIKLRRVLRAIRKHFPQPPDDVLAGNAIDKFLDDPDLCEDKLSEQAGSDGFLDSIMKMIFSDPGSLRQQNLPQVGSCDPYLEVYCNLYYLLAQSEEMSATDKWAGFVLTKEGEEFVAQNANLFKYDLLYNLLRLESWQRLANLYDEEVDLLLNDGSKQINVLAWRKNATLPQRVEASRRRSRRCLLMTLALAKTAVQQGEIHELLALVYYDGLQNVVPFFDQRFTLPSKDGAWMMFCENSLRHFKKAFANKGDWSYAFYLGKLCEKLGYSYDMSFSYYAKAISLNPSAVDPFYRMHASRLKLLCKCGKQNEEAIKVVAAYSYSESTRETVMKIMESGPDTSESQLHMEDTGCDANSGCNMRMDFCKLGEVWNMLYNDCLSALEICVEGDLKHFHKARYMLAQGFYQRGGVGDLEKAKEELSFCFKSSRSSFTINMWEIDSMVKKGRRKAPGLCGSKKVLEVNLPESSRKFITCIRKYVLFYLKLLEETGDICTLDRAYNSLRTDKRFSLCLEDLVPVAFGRYIKALISAIQKDTGSDAAGTVEHLLEKMFSLFLEQINLWSDVCSLPEIKSPELTESSLYGYVYKHVQLLEQNLKVEALEAINEKIRKRLKNPKLSSSNCAKVYKHVSLAWCRSLVISMALITPLHSRVSSDLQVQDPFGSGSESTQLLCVDLQSEELWNSSFEDPTYLKNLETKWNPALSKIKNVIIKRVPDEDLETANMLLRSSYNFYKDTSCALLPSGINLYMVPSQLVTETYIQPGIDGVDILDMNTSRKLLLWAYTLLHGHYANVSVAIKYCEENAKSKMKKGAGSSSVPSNANTTATAPHTGGGKDGSGKSCGLEASPQTTVAVVSLPEADSACTTASASLRESGNMLNLNSVASPEGEDTYKISERQDTYSVPAASLSESGSTNQMNATPSNEKHKISSSTPYLLHCSNSSAERSDADIRQDIDLNK